MESAVHSINQIATPPLLLMMAPLVTLMALVLLIIILMSPTAISLLTAMLGLEIMLLIHILVRQKKEKKR